MAQQRQVPRCIPSTLFPLSSPDLAAAGILDRRVQLIASSVKLVWQRLGYRPELRRTPCECRSPDTTPGVAEAYPLAGADRRAVPPAVRASPARSRRPYKQCSREQAGFAGYQDREPPSPAAPAGPRGELVGWPGPGWLRRAAAARTGASAAARRSVVSRVKPRLVEISIFWRFQSSPLWRPNVGKSTFVNRLCRKSAEAIVRMTSRGHPGTVSPQEGFLGDSPTFRGRLRRLVFTTDSEFCRKSASKAQTWPWPKRGRRRGGGRWSAGLTGRRSAPPS